MNVRGGSTAGIDLQHRCSHGLPRLGYLRLKEVVDNLLQGLHLCVFHCSRNANASQSQERNVGRQDCLRTEHRGAIQPFGIFRAHHNLSLHTLIQKNSQQGISGPIPIDQTTWAFPAQFQLIKTSWAFPAQFQLIKLRGHFRPKSIDQTTRAFPAQVNQTLNSKP